MRLTNLNRFVRHTELENLFNGFNKRIYKRQGGK